MRTIRQIVADLGAGGSSRALLEECLGRIDDPAGEGRRTFLKVHRDTARAAADAADRQRRAGRTPSPFAGIPVAIKDLFDIAGDVTTAGSIALKDAQPAATDAPAVARLRAAGFIPVGRTNMTEFAYSGLGINPHYDTPRNPYDRASGRIPGGSSSGAAVSVADGMAFGALGSDTGGSCRIPAALCGIVGFKPTQRRVPTDGAFPLSPSLDSIGPLAASVDCCAVLDATLAGELAVELPPVDPRQINLALPQTEVLDVLDRHVAAAFDAALTKIGAAGIRVREIPFAELAELPAINAKGGFPAYESWQIHRELIAQKGTLYDPRVLVRVERGQKQSAAEYAALKRARADFIRRAHEVTAPYDALVLPTTPVIAPTLAEVEPDGAYRHVNMLVLRNPAIANFIDGCSISIPCHPAGGAPVGVMLIGAAGTDRRLLAIAAAIERLVSPIVSG
jgi:aspartyl-tRNA(Asn)/glutamyl-tRNA(Gln) amidotransferase subunit A